MAGKERLAEIQALLAENPQELGAALLEFFQEQYGGTGFLLRTLAEENPDVMVRYVLDEDRLLGPPRMLDPKVQELVALASATALQCDHCIKAHIGSALSNGATWQEILDTILIAAHTTESSVLSVALRSFKQEKARHVHAREAEG
jgi:AhpD family alkylhydroperoxidase